MVQINIDLTSEFERIRAEHEKTKTPRPPKKKRKKDTRGDDLTMRLMAVGGVSDESAVQLELDTVAYIEELLGAGRKKQAVSFLNDNKHRFTPDMKDSLTETINNGL